ncbi:hypothetical protein SCP_0300800 [Sparassis crispa]|uniref:Uncharacterized protein n=1 Tax=Sparassis crispa TaxID=139825 RepID=A0A401GE16_9APHY|nr:hypothetical protein SCP_0300800 [Sparassis crispa]GBE80365.1 hypothetical protein SCP_0300800 [Sparassis crispa]
MQRRLDLGLPSQSFLKVRTEILDERWKALPPEEHPKYSEKAKQIDEEKAKRQSPASADDYAMLAKKMSAVVNTSIKEWQKHLPGWSVHLKMGGTFGVNGGLKSWEFDVPCFGGIKYRQFTDGDGTGRWKKFDDHFMSYLKHQHRISEGWTSDDAGNTMLPPYQKTWTYDDFLQRLLLYFERHWEHQTNTTTIPWDSIVEDPSAFLAIDLPADFIFKRPSDYSFPELIELYSHLSVAEQELLEAPVIFSNEASHPHPPPLAQTLYATMNTDQDNGMSKLHTYQLVLLDLAVSAHTETNVSPPAQSGTVIKYSESSQRNIVPPDPTVSSSAATSSCPEPVSPARPTPAAISHSIYHPSPCSPSPTHEVKCERSDADSFIFELAPPSPPPPISNHSPLAEVPLRATGACSAMRKMMSVFRLDPFAVHNGHGAAVAALPLMEVHLEYSLVPQSPEPEDNHQYASHHIYRYYQYPPGHLSSSPAPSIYAGTYDALGDESQWLFRDWDLEYRSGPVDEPSSSFASIMTPVQSLYWGMQHGMEANIPFPTTSFLGVAAEHS